MCEHEEITSTDVLSAIFGLQKVLGHISGVLDELDGKLTRIDKRISQVERMLDDKPANPVIMGTREMRAARWPVSMNRYRS